MNCATLGGREQICGLAGETPPRGWSDAMATKRKPTAPTTEAIDQFCAVFDDLFAR